MNKIFFLYGLGIGVAGVVAYLLHGLKAGRKWSSEDAVAVLAAGVGVASASQVCWVAIADSEMAPINGIWVQMFIGGFALGLFALRTAVKKFRGE